MDNFIKLRTLANEEKDIHFSFDHCTKAVIEQESYLYGLWHDTMSKNLWTKYAFPFEHDSLDICKNRRKAIELSDNIILLCELIGRNCIKINRLSEDISESIKDSYKNQHNCFQYLRDCIKTINQCNELEQRITNDYNSLKKEQNKFEAIFSQKKSIY